MIALTHAFTCYPRTLLPGLVLALLLALPSATTLAATDPEVEYLLNYVAKSGCIFTRNGSDHDAADAADHLRLKYSRGSKYAGSAEDFIDRLASSSSWTGKPYTVTCQGQAQGSGKWLHRALQEYRKSSAAP